MPSITRKTDKGLPQYRDAEESDVFILSGAEDLVPVLVRNARASGCARTLPPRTVDGATTAFDRYRPRIEGLFARIERWTNAADAGDVHWRSISKDNITTWYGRTPSSRIADPADPRRIFSWLICETHDDKGNAVLYDYKAEDGAGVDLAQRPRAQPGRPQTIRAARPTATSSASATATARRCWTTPGSRPALADRRADRERRLDVRGRLRLRRARRRRARRRTTPAHGPTAPDPFSSYRAGFEVRTYRLCQRVLMFHHFPDEAGRRTRLPRPLHRLHLLGRSQIPPTLATPSTPSCARSPRLATAATTAAIDKRSLPPVEFEYTEPIVQDAVQEVDAESLENLPIGLDGSAYQWIDLHGEGIPGILTEQAGAWFYKRNLSPIPTSCRTAASTSKAQFAPLEAGRRSSPTSP